MQYYNARLADFILAVDGDVVHFINLPFLHTYESSVHTIFSTARLIIGQGSPTKITKSDSPYGIRSLDSQESGQT